MLDGYHPRRPGARNREICMTDMNDRINQWLLDAHAMEEQAETILSGQTRRIESYPELEARMKQHLEETRSQRKRLEQCIERRGASHSSMKDMVGKFTATMQNLSGVFAGDEVVKGVLASYAFEHMEIGSYRILIAACDAVGDHETKAVLEDICREEEAMAAWLSDAIPEITSRHLLRTEADVSEAKR
jgi:ferritin-like metal-binding protein YciE